MNAKKIFYSSLIGLGQLISTNALCGSSSGNGGFAFSNSKKLLKIGISQAVTLLKDSDQDCVNLKMLKNEAGPVDLEIMKQIIEKTHFNILDEKVRKNDEGQVEPLVINYAIDENGPYIEALKTYFIGFMLYQGDVLASSFQEEMTVNLLLHESSHHFKYNEKQAGFFADFLTEKWSNGHACQKKNQNDK